MKLIASLAFILCSFHVLAEGRIIAFRNTKSIAAELDPHPKFQVGRRVIFLSRKDGKVVAFGRIKKVNQELIPYTAQIDIEEIVDNSLVDYDDEIFPLSYNLLRFKKIPGFTSLTLGGSDKIPSQYKELAYLGVFTAEGHTLDKNEVLASPFQIQYGISNNFGIKHVNALLLDGYLNLGAKLRVVRNKYSKISANTLVAYKTDRQDWIWQTGLILTLPRNGKYQNHIAASFTIDPQFDEAKATKDLNLFQSSDIRNITEYITDSWNRVLFGMLYEVELQSFGGTVSYMWIWDTFHVSLGLATRDFTQLNFDRNGYYYVYDFFWRF